MIPDFDANGNLPAGIHDSTIDEFQKRFAYNIIRKRLLTGLLKLIADLKAIDCKTIYIDGSYVTAKILPRDIDLCWDERSVDLANAKIKMPILFDLDPPREAQHSIYGCDVLLAYDIEFGSKIFFIDFFQLDRDGMPKGIVQIKI